MATESTENTEIEKGIALEDTESTDIAMETA